MIFEHSYTSYPKSYKIINDCRILRALKNRGFIDSYDKKFKYIDCSLKQQITRINYKNDKYEIKYFDGCFSPFIVKLANLNK